MTHEQVLNVVLREMLAFGTGWRHNWSDFDGRSLRSQMEHLANWATSALSGDALDDYTEGTEFLKEQCQQ